MDIDDWLLHIAEDYDAVDTISAFADWLEESEGRPTTAYALRWMIRKNKRPLYRGVHKSGRVVGVDHRWAWWREGSSQTDTTLSASVPTCEIPKHLIAMLDDYPFPHHIFQPTWFSCVVWLGEQLEKMRKVLE